MRNFISNSTMNSLKEEAKDRVDVVLRKNESIDSIYKKIAFISQYDRVYQLLEYKKGDVLFVINIIENEINKLDERYSLNIHSQYNNWLAGYLRNHISYNVDIHENTAPIKEQIERIGSTLVEALSELPYMERDSKSEQTLEIFNKVESLGLINKINYLQSEIFTEWSSNKDLPVIELNRLCNLCYSKTEIAKLVRNEIFNIAKELVQEELSGNMGNMKLYLQFYRTLFYLVRNRYLFELKDAINKTLTHCESLNSEDLAKFMDKFKNGLPLTKLRTNTIDYFNEVKNTECTE